MAAARPADTSPPPLTLPPVRAVGIRLDTLVVGGYTAGAFVDAVRGLPADLGTDEPELVGRHLDRIFAGVIPEGGVGRAGRLRLALERAVRPDGSVRAVRVLGAEVAVAGRIHTAYFFELDGRPEYFDALGRPLEGGDWGGGPLPEMRVNSPFGASRMHPILGRILPHAGVDLAAEAGQPVRATADGVVAWAGSRGGYGLLVEVRHPNGFSTRYAHLSAISPAIHPGKPVRQGEVIGYVGMTGLATGPHLHYEVLSRGQAVDPLRLMRSPAFDTGAAGDPRWPMERRRIGSLLAAAPTVSKAPTAVESAP